VVTTKSYDAANRLITVTTDGVPRTLAWSDAGELLQDGDDTYQWDAAGRLTRATVEGVTSRFAYLGDGGVVLFRGQNIDDGGGRDHDLHAGCGRAAGAGHRSE
jgi:YD repeat-containing protein